MLDLGFVRDNLELVKQRMRDRGFPAPLEDFERLDFERRTLLKEAESRKARRNQVSEQIAALKKQKLDAGGLIAEMKQLKEEIEDFDARAANAGLALSELLKGVPNLPHSTTPVGRGSEDNQEVRRWGEPRRFDFEPKAHWDLGPALGILDFERAAKISGARFAVYYGLGARLERALANFMLDVHTREHGYTEVLPPFVVNSASLYGTGNLPKFAGDLFRVEKGDPLVAPPGELEGEGKKSADLWLIPTAEVPVTNLYRDEVLEFESLPVKHCAWTACFRSEAGSYGKDTRGIIRQHQFQKVELVKFALPERSYEELESLTRDAEAILQRLELPYRVVALSTGDLGFSSAKTYDLEVWLPSSREYKEISSCSNFEAFQARRANLRFRREKSGKTEFLHTLNGSGLAVGRTWLAVLENGQQEDGSVVIPAALRPYLDGLDRIRAR
ncbi:MAG TPA: serine--tRNA ligase [Terriglobia bacterium]|nr:serine--tRNA ligase [Terriglobia bacterium]